MATLGKTYIGIRDQAVPAGGVCICKTEVLTENADVYEAVVYIRTNDTEAYCKVGIWNTDFTFVTGSLSNEMSVTGILFSWHTVTFPSNPQLISGKAYILGIVDDNLGDTLRLSNGYEGADTGGIDLSKVFDYTNGEDLIGPVVTDRRMDIYVNYNAAVPGGPSLKVEGITPNKLEHTSWANINNIY